MRERDKPGDKPVDWVYALMPAADYEVVDDWHVLGMCATGSKTVRITFDPQFAGAVDVDAWHVIGSDPKIYAYYSMADCSLVADK